MNVASVKIALRLIGKLYKDILLEDDAQRVLEEAVRYADTSWERYSENPQANPTWGYRISHEAPLRFKETEVPKYCQVDVYCDVQWDDEELPAKQDIKIRVWSDHKSFAYRSKLDAKQIEEKLTDPSRTQSGRVISRLHFDKVNHSQGKSNEYHPKFHLQMGGKSEDYELCWHPKSLDIPRLGYHPMELFLTCQLVAANFFPTSYAMIRKERAWINQLYSTQTSLLLDYYAQCLQIIRDVNKRSLLDELASL